MQIQEEMRKTPGCEQWDRKLLYGENGWIEKFGFEEAQRRYLERTQALEQMTEDATQDMLTELLQIRKSLYEDMKANNATADPQKIYAYNQVSRTLMQLLKNSDAQQQIEPVNIDETQIWQVLNSIPEVKDAIEKNKKEIIKKIESGA
jgi:hypothetical protein